MRSVGDFDPRDEHITDLVLDEWLSDELATEDRARVDAHFASCQHCRDKRASFEAQNAVFWAQAPQLKSPVAAASGASERASTPRWLPRLIVGGAGALAAAAAVLLMLRTGPGTELPTSRLKGGPSASFFIKHGERVTRGVSGATVQPGDALRFTYSSEQPVHFALLGLDARSATVYFPSGERAVRMAAGQDVALDFSIELDDQLGEESIHALFCSEPVVLPPLRAQLASTRALKAPAGCTTQRIVLRKALPR